MLQACLMKFRSRGRADRGIRSALFLGAVLSLSIGGCHQGPTFVDIPGMVLVDGTPVGGVQVIFHPGDPTRNPASGVSNEDGSFRLTTGTHQGVSPGEYTVTAVYPDPSVVPTPQQKMMGTDEPGPDLFQGKYGTASTSPIKVSIEPSDQEIAQLSFTTK